MERERQREKESITEKYNIVSENNNKIKTERTRRAGGGCKQYIQYSYIPGERAKKPV